MFVLTLWAVRVTIVAMDVGLHVAVNNIKPLSVVIETQERFLLQLSSYQTFRTAINNINTLGIHVKCQLLLSDFNHIWSSPQIFVQDPT